VIFRRVPAFFVCRTFSTSIKIESGYYTTEDEGSAESELILKLAQTSSESEEQSEVEILKVPKNINAFKLAKILDKDPLEILKLVQEVTNDVCADEFQILTDEAIELVCMQLDREIEL
jgi:hypothetical protein